MLTPFQTLLIANRGEIAVRIIRTARGLGLRTIAVFSDADAGAPHVTLADDAINIGPPPVGESYLKPEAILEAARICGAQAIHPGYGFLSENADFARAVEAAGLVFVGPPARTIEVMGDKAGAKRAMIEAGVPCIAGYQGVDQSDETLFAEAARIGFPVMLKASAGGGGRGMRLVERAEAMPGALARARSEALSAFGSDAMILEKAVLRPRHVEIQIFADAHGNCIHLGERDCSVQRRHQKVVEEAPCPAMTPQLRRRMGEAAIAAAQAVDYRSAGTVEFLLDQTGEFFFLEMNTRLQVEHPVTEMVTGLDLVAMQIAVAQGSPLPLSQADLQLCGHAIEVRLYAEDPTRDFLPVTGRIEHWSPAEGEGIRIDAGIASGQDVSPWYDAMLAKIIAHGETREIARQRLLAALERTALLGMKTNAAFLADILQRPAFADGEATTAFIGETWPEGFAAQPATGRAIAIATALVLHRQSRAARAASTLPDDTLLGFASDGGLPVPVDLAAGGAIHRLTALAVDADGWAVSGDGWRHTVLVDRVDDARARVTVDDRRQEIFLAPDDSDGLHLQIGVLGWHFTRHRPWATAIVGEAGARVTAPMPGLVVSIEVAPGDAVASGQIVAVLEAMKMQHQLLAKVDGIVSEIAVAPGDRVASGTLMIAIEETPA